MKLKNMRRGFKGGFTLIELLVVIAIIGILSSVVLVSLNSARSKGSDARIQEEVAQIRTQLETDYNGSSYSNDLTVPTTAHITTSATPNITTEVSDISKQNGAAATTLATAIPTSGTTWGTLILSSAAVSGTVGDYAIYSRTSAGYQCIDSTGRTLTNTAAGWPTYGTDSNGKVQCQ